jgi:transcriptional regulator with XRE-family HTH domain
MRELKDNVDAAIRASGKTAAEIAATLNVNENTISRIRKGQVVNPGVQLLRGIARETGTTVGALLGEEQREISPEDDRELERIRRWIERTRRTIDALGEPNAEILATPPALLVRRRVADYSSQAGGSPFGPDPYLLLRALGDSMREDGILPDDTLYIAPAETTRKWPAGKIVAFRSGRGVYVKRLVSSEAGRMLVSAHPRYLPIAMDESFELLGTVIGRVGRVG